MATRHHLAPLPRLAAVVEETVRLSQERLAGVAAAAAPIPGQVPLGRQAKDLQVRTLGRSILREPEAARARQVDSVPQTIKEALVALVPLSSGAFSLAVEGAAPSV